MKRKTKREKKIWFDEGHIKQIPKLENLKKNTEKEKDKKHTRNKPELQPPISL